MELDLAQLDALSHAVSEGTFEAAARALHVTPSAVSQRIKALETGVGRILLERTKPVRPTASGESLLRLAVQLRAMVDDVAQELGADDAAAVATVSLAANADSLATWLLPALAAVPGPVLFDLHRDDEDLTADLLRRGTVMAAVTSDRTPVPGCSVRRLGRMRYRAAAAPEFAGRWFAEGLAGGALAAAPMVVFDRADQLQDRFVRRHLRRAVEPPRHYVPSSADFVRAVRLGLGWGMLPDLQAGDLLARGELVELDPGHAVDVPLYWQQWKIASAPLTAVAEAVAAAAAHELA